MCHILLIAPRWPQRAWYPLLLDLLVDRPIPLPLLPDLLSQQSGRFVLPNPAMLHLHAWTLLSMESERQGFREQLPLMSLYPDEALLSPFTMPSGESSAVGAVEGRLFLRNRLIHQIADFLVYLFEDLKLAPSTIKGYRVMLSYTLKMVRHASKPGSHPIIAELIRSFALASPLSRSLTP